LDAEMSVFSYNISGGGGSGISTLANGTALKSTNGAGDGTIDLIKATAGNHVNIGADATRVYVGSPDDNGTYVQTQAAGNVRILTKAGETGGTLEIDTETVFFFGPGTFGGAGTTTLALYDSDGDHFVGIKAPTTIATDYTITLPVDDGASGQVLSTNGSGVTSWIDRDAPSDERLKKVFGPILYGLKDLKKIRPIAFKWNDNERFDQRLHIGLSAQNVASVIPQAVYENDKGEKLIEDRALIAMLVNAVKELTAKVEALEAKA
jgi:hypothetical protein